MKKLIILISFFLLPLSSFAAGPFDGIWQIESLGYTTISERNGVVVAVNVYDRGDWEAYRGVRNNNLIRFETIKSTANTVLNVVITSDTTATVTQESCVPVVQGSACLLPNGVSLNAVKVW